MGLKETVNNAERFLGWERQRVRGGEEKGELHRPFIFKVHRNEIKVFRRV